MLGEIRGTIRYKEPLAYHTAIRIGGPADMLVVAETCDDVRHALSFAEREQLPVTVLGAGNNTLVRERGVRGVVVKLGACFTRSEFQGEDMIVGASANLSGVIREAAAVELGGLEPLAGIPGSIGGILITGAGATDASLVDAVSAVYFLHPDGSLGEWKPNHFQTEREAFELPRGGVVLGARVHLRRRPRPEIQKDIQARLKQRRATDPLALASLGYVWKNPAGESAARLVERVSLKGKRLNGAEISAKHANIIINRGGAGTADVIALMDLARDRVAAKLGVTLEPDIRIIGE